MGTEIRAYAEGLPKVLKRFDDDGNCTYDAFSYGGVKSYPGEVLDRAIKRRSDMANYQGERTPNGGQGTQTVWSWEGANEEIDRRAKQRMREWNITYPEAVHVILGEDKDLRTAYHLTPKANVGQNGWGWKE